MYHLKNDLGLHKQVLKNIFKEAYSEVLEDERVERGLDLVEGLLNRRGQGYTADEVLEIINTAYFTAHDECVLDNEDDYSNVEVATSQKKEAKLQKIEKLIFDNGQGPYNK
jgi:hypothetical protein